MNFKYPNSKKLYLVIEITKLLNEYSCTYNEADDVLRITTDEIKQQRENKEYVTLKDYFNGHKTRNVDDEIIDVMNHVISIS